MSRELQLEEALRNLLATLELHTDCMDGSIDRAALEDWIEEAEELLGPLAGDTEVERKKRIYISGPMTGMPDQNYPAFNAEAARLRALGYDVVNPAELNHPQEFSWRECLRRDLAELLNCDVIALLDGWTESDGAHLEMHVSHRVGIEIVIAREIQS